MLWILIKKNRTFLWNKLSCVFISINYVYLAIFCFWFVFSLNSRFFITFMIKNLQFKPKKTFASKNLRILLNKLIFYWYFFFTIHIGDGLVYIKLLTLHACLSKYRISSSVLETSSFHSSLFLSCSSLLNPFITISNEGERCEGGGFGEDNKSKKVYFSERF